MAVAKAQSITLSVGKEQGASTGVVDYAQRFLSAAVLGVSFILLLNANLGLSGIGASPRAMVIACLVAAAVALLPVAVGRPLSDRIGNQFAVPLVAVLAVIAVCVVFREAFSQGLNAYLNQLASLRCGATGLIQPKFDDGGAPGASVMFFSIVLAAAVGAFSVFATAGRRIWAAFILPVVVLVGVAFGVVRADQMLGVFFAAVAVTLVGKCVRGGDDLSSARKAPILGALGVVGLALVIAAVALSGAYRVLDAGSVPAQAQAWFHKAVYEPHRNPLPEGDLRNLGGMRATGDTMLSVTMSEPEAAYLRGLVCETYRDARWRQLDAAQYQAYSDLFYWLHESGFYGQSQPASAYKVADPAAETATMEVENVGACRSVVYIPYGLDQEQAVIADARRIGDEGIAGNPQQTSWTISYVPHAVYRSYLLQQELNQNPPSDEVATSYYSNEQAYRAMAYATCMDLSSEHLEALEECLGPRTSLSSTQAKIRISEFFANNVEYRTEVGSVADKDPITWFLTERHAGHSVHYASAAVMMLRYYGIPARYVEGYVVTRDAAKEAAESGQAVNVTDQQAHAWAEYYLDGVGWLPFEATPKYRSETMYALAGQAIEDPNSSQANTYGDVANAQAQQEMEQFEEPNILDDMTEQVQETASNVLDTLDQNKFTLLWILLGLLLLLLLVLLAITVTRRVRLARFIRSFDGADRNHATRAAFAYAVSLVKRRLPEVDTTFLRSYSEQVAGAFACGSGLEESLAINERAKYSDHEITEEQRGAVRQFARSVTEEYKAGRNPLQRLYDRLVLCIY